MEDEDLIRNQMEDTRTSMTEKLETLEQKVVETVQETTNAVTETVATVKDSINDTVSTVTDTVQGTVTAVKDTMEGGVDAVKDLFDIPGHVERHPWPMMGGSFAVGFLMGKLLGSDGPAVTHAKHGSSYREPSRPLHTATNGSNGGRADTPAPKKAGLLDSFGPELDKLKGLAVGTLMGAVREFALKSVPEQMADKVKEIIDNVTQKLGGDPLPAGQGLGGSSSSTGESSPSESSRGTSRSTGPAFRRTADPAY